MQTMIRLKYATDQMFSPGGGITVSYTFVKVKVANIAFAKDVAVMYRGVDGLWKDRPLVWLVSGGDYDVFHGSGPYTEEFALRYSVGGNTYWDNNHGANYHLTNLRNASGDNVMLNRATARRGVQAGGGFTFATSWIEGEIYVNNLSYAKEVGVRLSADGGATWADTFAVYHGPASEATYVSTTGVEVWKFKSPELNLDERSPVFLLAVFYRRLDSGDVFWDSNFARDYKLSKADGVTID
ncbi:MAG: hypothetical protein WCA12_11905 [Burkholderiales bacterium]